MKLHFEQSGGFAGLLRAAELDTAHMPSEAAKELERLVRASGLAKTPTAVSEAGRDRKVYEITIEDDGSTISRTFDDQSMPDAARALVGFLKQHAQPSSPR